MNTHHSRRSIVGVELGPRPLLLAAVSQREVSSESAKMYEHRESHLFSSRLRRTLRPFRCSTLVEPSFATSSLPLASILTRSTFSAVRWSTAEGGSARPKPRDYEGVQESAPKSRVEPRAKTTLTLYLVVREAQVELEGSSLRDSLVSSKLMPEVQPPRAKERAARGTASTLLPS